MVDELTTFRLFSSLKLHFSTPSYDITKYGLNRKRFNQQALNSRNDRYFYYRIGNDFINQRKLEAFFVSNLVFKPQVWIGDLLNSDEAWENYGRFKMYRDAKQRYLGRDTQYLIEEAGGFKTAFKEIDSAVPFVDAIVEARINPETAVIYDRTMGLFGYISRTVGFNWNPVWNSLENRLRKFSCFVTLKDVAELEMCKQTIERVINETEYEKSTTH